MKTTKLLLRIGLTLILAIPLGYRLPYAYSWLQASVASDHETHDEEDHEHSVHHHPQHRILGTSPIYREITSSKSYVCQVKACKHIEIRALNTGYLEEILVKEGQPVTHSDLMFRILPTLYKARFDSEAAEAQLAQLEYNNTQRLVRDNVVSKQELALAGAKVAKANANADLAKAELGFTEMRAPFDGIIDRLHEQKGSLVEEGDILTTLSDNSVMWVYFNVPEARYLEYKSDPKFSDLQVELFLANGAKFEQPGHIGAIEADFNNETGNIAFRADFPNPDRLLRHGQTGTIVLSRKQHNALVIPQRATFEILAKKFVFVIDQQGVVHQQEIQIQNELDDIYVIQSGLNAQDRIILEGVQQVRDGDKIEYEFEPPEAVLSNLKFKAE